MADPRMQAILAAIYGEIHDHVREAGKKRDQLIAFYLVVLVALVGAWEKLAAVRSAALASVWIAGLISFLIVMRYRAWHVTHGAAMVTFQRLMLEPDPLTLEHCQELWEQTNDTEIGFFRLFNPMRGVESGMTWLFAFLTMIPGFLLLDASGFALVHMSSRGWAFVADLVVYVPGLAAVSTGYIMRKHRFQPDLWAFRWLRRPKTAESSNAQIGAPVPGYSHAKAGSRSSQSAT